MNIEKLKEIIKESIKKLFEEDKYLLDTNVNERSISHKLACYIGNRIKPKKEGGWNVDAEYNRNKDGVKRLNCQEYNYQRIYPDIIIHRRGLSNNKIEDNNLLVIEIKKNEYNNKDIEKICCLIKESPYYYKYGLFINLKINNGNPNCIYFKRNNEHVEAIVEIDSTNLGDILAKFRISQTDYKRMSTEKLAVLEV